MIKLRIIKKYGRQNGKAKIRAYIPGYDAVSTLAGKEREIYKNDFKCVEAQQNIKITAIMMFYDIKLAN